MQVIRRTIIVNIIDSSNIWLAITSGVRDNMMDFDCDLEDLRWSKPAE